MLHDAPAKRTLRKEATVMVRMPPWVLLLLLLLLLLLAAGILGAGWSGGEEDVIGKERDIRRRSEE